MTLYGEQEGDEIDWELAEKNRKLWNAWVCQGIGANRLNIANAMSIEPSEVNWTSNKANEVDLRFAEQWRLRNNGESPPKVPSPIEKINLGQLRFPNVVFLEKLIFTDTSLIGTYFQREASFAGALFLGDINHMVKAFSGGVTFSGADFRKSAVFSGCKISHFANFSGTKFRGDANFSQVEIVSEADFSGATFQGDSQFLSTIFSAGVDFSRSVFEAKADFSDAKIGDEELFASSINFASTSFHEATFNRAVLSLRADFSKSRFENTASFSGARFRDDVSFRRAVFGEDCYFNGARFSKLADFHFASFEGNAGFRGNNGRPTKSSAQAHFGTNTDLVGAHFRKRADFFGRRFGPPEGRAEKLIFSNAIFDGPVSFEQAEFPCLFPVLTNTILPESTKITIIDQHWPKLKPDPLGKFQRYLKNGPEIYADQSPEIVRASAATLRHAMARQMLPEEEHFFFRREMWGAERTGGLLRRIPVWIYGALSDYGHSIGRPVILLAALWLAGFLTFARFGGLSHWESAFFSFANMFKFFGLLGTYFEDVAASFPQQIQVAAGSQTVVAFILLFFLGLGLRTRFRLR